jgi:hypothetical protein
MAKKKPVRLENKPDGEEVSPPIVVAPAPAPAKAVIKAPELPKTAKELKALKKQKALQEANSTKEQKSKKDLKVAKVPVIEPVPEPEPVVIVKKKRPRFVREKKEKKAQTETAPLAPRSTSLAGKLMSKNIVPLPKEEDDIWPKGKK